MSTAIARVEFTDDKIDLLKRTICKGATDDEFSLFLGQCERTGLDPFAKQIHAVKRWDAKQNRNTMSIQIGIDGYRLIADRTGLYAGNDDPVYDDEESPSRASVTVYKLVGGVRCAFTATARWKEYYPGDSQGFMWKRMPCVMLGKCAEALALRKAFPAELSGLYTDAEMEQADARHAAPPHQPVAALPPRSEDENRVSPVLAYLDALADVATWAGFATLRAEANADAGLKGVSAADRDELRTAFGNVHKRLTMALGAQPDATDPAAR